MRGLSRIGRYQKTVDCGRKGTVETAGPVDEALIGWTGRLSLLGNYSKSIDRGREGTVETQLPAGPIKTAKQGQRR